MRLELVEWTLKLTVRGFNDECLTDWFEQQLEALLDPGRGWGGESYMEGQGCSGENLNKPILVNEGTFYFLFTWIQLHSLICLLKDIILKKIHTFPGVGPGWAWKFSGTHTLTQSSSFLMEHRSSTNGRNLTLFSHVSCLSSNSVILVGL